jgi:hypothetical protein
MHKRILLWLASVLAGLTSGNAQTLSPQAGYAIITPQGGSVTTLTAVATTLFSATDAGIVLTDTGPSPLLTNAVLPVNVGPPAAMGIGLSLVNPSLNAATINLTITNAAGIEILNRTISVGRGEQFSQFINEFFVDQPDLTAEFPALLTITSNIPVAVLALDFRGVGVTPVPITNLAGASPFSNTTVTPPPVAVIPTFPGVAPIGCVATTIGIAPPLTTGCLTTPPVTPPVTTAQLQPAAINGRGTFVFPQVLSGPGITTNLTVGNASASTQAIRIDFFSSAGDVISTVSAVPIPPHGLVVFSSASIGIIPTR